MPKFEFDEPYGQIQKCQFCNQAGVERLDRGLLPGCVEVCPTGASLFGTREEMLAEAKRRLALAPGEEYQYPRGTLQAGNPHPKPAPKYQQKVYGETQGGGTQVVHVAAVPFEKLGLPILPERAFAATSETVQHTVYKGFVAPLALLGGLTWLVHRNTRHHEQASGAEDDRHE